MDWLDYYRTRYEVLREANAALKEYERDDYGGGCCGGTSEGQVVVIGLYLIIIALLAYLLLLSNVSSGRRRRELTSHQLEWNIGYSTATKGRLIPFKSSRLLLCVMQNVLGKHETILNTNMKLFKHLK